MNKSKKISIIIAIILFVIGVIISACGLCSINFDFSTLNTMNTVTKTYTVDESFRNIHIEGAECDVRLMASNDDKCRVICNESDKISHSVSTQNETLTIKRIDNRKWYEHIGIFFWDNIEIDVYLPEIEYKELYIKSMSGNIEIPENFTFSKADVDSTSGDVSFLSNVKKEASIKTVSGDIYVGKSSAKKIDIHSTSGDLTISSINFSDEIKVKSVSGDIKLSNIECQNIISNTTSGNHTFSSVNAKNNIRIESVSGDVDLYQCDSETMNIKTTSGDVTGTLLTDKIFDIKTTSGNINVPQSDIGGKCEIRTTSGDVKLAINKQ
ncbi:MAG: DUF4097 family beta strand repeat protein [Ruminococcus sp.]|nr:DUF4097 family beta strand repeat protein [Ruminococcus sp.]